jgi:hypothetical protein
MSGFFVLVSFELNNKGLLSDWKILSKEIDDDISSVKGFISRDCVGFSPQLNLQTLNQ